MQHTDFYQHLRSLRPEGAGVLASRLYQGTEWYTEGVLNLSTKEPLASKYVPKVIPTDHSEKAKTIESLKKFGLSKGSYIGIKRILSCHPIKLLGGGSSFDFVPNKNTLKKKI